jgi:hypothetical protein
MNLTKPSQLMSCSSWMDRIPFVLLFGVATSVDLFYGRIPRAASRCLCGSQFDVEQTSQILERVFQKAIAGSKAPLRLGPVLVSSLVERQHDHVQSVQAFTAALKVSSSTSALKSLLTVAVCIHEPVLFKCFKLPNSSSQKLFVTSKNHPA